MVCFASFHRIEALCVYISDAVYVGRRRVYPVSASVVGRFSRAPQIQSSILLTDMEIITTDDHNWYSKQPSQH